MQILDAEDEMQILDAHFKHLFIYTRPGMSKHMFKLLTSRVNSCG